MGDRPLIPFPDAVKDKVDVVAMPTALLGYFKAVPWPEIAAALACLYTLLRIIEVVAKWWRKRK